MDHLPRLRQLVIFVLVLLLMAAGIALFSTAQAQTEYPVYLPLVARDGEPKSTPTPTRWWQPWEEPIE